MSRALWNLHNHTPFSDGAYTIDEICEAHLRLDGVSVEAVGVCDHLFRTPTSLEPRDDREFERVFGAEARRYVEQTLSARERWQGRMKVFCGCEINWPMNRERLDQIRNLIDGVDYVLFEYLDWAALTQLANQARKWPCPVGLAHTEVARQFPNTSMDQIVRTLANARIFYEINSKFLPLQRRQRWFDVLAQHRVRVSLGTDTHDDLAVLSTLADLHSFAREHGLDEKYLELSLPEPAAASA
jgi:histidinol phosphatase-like PHP family hydrolase